MNILRQNLHQPFLFLKWSVLAACAIALACVNYWFLSEYFGRSLESDSSSLTQLNLVLLLVGEGALILLVVGLLGRPLTRRLHRFRYSLRWFLILPLLVSLILLYFRYASDVKNAVAAEQGKKDAIKFLDNRISEYRLILATPHEFTKYELEYLKTATHLKQLDLGQTNVDDQWLPALVQFKDLEALSLRSTKISDAGLSHLSQLGSLRRLDLGFCQISDTGLSQLRNLKKLQSLHLYGTNVADGGMVHVGEMMSLTELFVSDTKISDAGLGELSNLSELQVLMLMNTSVTDEGIGQLSCLASLRSLFLGGPGITDQAVNQLVKIPGLNAVAIRGSTLTDQGLKHLRKMSEISHLDLSDNKAITAIGIKGLSDLKKLRSLVLIDVPVADEAVQELQKSLPDCRIMQAYPLSLPR